MESGLRSISLSPSVRTVRQSAFCGCPNLEGATLNEGLEELGTREYSSDGSRWHGVFEGSAIKNVRLPSTLKRIEYGAFRECTRLRTIAFPEGFERVGPVSFAGVGLERVEFPASLKTIGQASFYSCKSLGHVKFSEGLEVLIRSSTPTATGTAECLRRVLWSVELPATLKEVKRSTFRGCKRLKGTELPNGLEYIGEHCFQESALEFISLPPKLKTIGSYTFYRCEGLTNT